MNMYSNTNYKFFSQEEKERFFNVVDTYEIRYRLRNKAIIYLAKYCALRVSEITNMKVEQINLKKREIFCLRGKNGNSNTLKIIDDNVYSILKNYMYYRDMLDIRSEYLFTSQKSDSISRKTIDKFMKQYGELADISPDKCHFHVLRHTRAIELAEMGFDTKEIQFWLGHKNITNTEIYFKFTTKQQESLYAKLNSEPLFQNVIDQNYLYTIVKTIIQEERSNGQL
ncbi:MAG: phage integrase family protein [Candidatus Galacturonibacter soehngenii]|nr:phage integrase family protein [Candidatus Galacturonibacter soehngenii]